MEQFGLSSKLLKLLSIFFLDPKKPFYVRSVAKNLRWPVSTTSRLLTKLQQLEILNSKIQGNLKFYELNPRYPLFSELQNIIHKQFGPTPLIQKILSATHGVSLASIYGSAAKNQLSSLSDIDLLIVGSPPIDKLNHQLNQLEKVINREINYTLYSQAEFQKERHCPGFLATILKQKHIKLINRLPHE